MKRVVLSPGHSVELGSMVNDSPRPSNGLSSGNNHVTKQIFVTGGVVSSLGKGLTASSLGMLLRARGLHVVMQKLDPYLNVDPGLMDPFQHGEVFVTEDGSETDLDIGHYERFLNVSLSGGANATTGKVYSSVLANDRRGFYGGETVQVIPHVTNEIARRMRIQAEPTDGSPAPDVIITEIGGTVGDIEEAPYLEAARQVRRELGRDNCMFIHVSLLPYVQAAGEIKTKPTQHSVATLRSVGIQPDVIVLRTEVEVPDSIKRKVSMMCDVDLEGVILCPDASSLYAVPKVLHRQGLDAFVVRRLDLLFHDVDWTRWDDLLRRVNSPLHQVEIALVGKYTELQDAYLSATEALKAGGFANDCRVKTRWIRADKCATPEAAAKALADVDGILLPGTFGNEKIEGILGALEWARKNSVPVLGIGLGAQCMVIDAAKGVLADVPVSGDAADHPLIIENEVVVQQAEDGTNRKTGMRAGAYPAALVEGSRVQRIYGETLISERHHQSAEINREYEDALAGVGLRFSGFSPDGSLVEFVEMDEEQHPFYIGTQARPEFKSRPTSPHPLFTEFVKAAIKRQASALESPAKAE